MIITCAFHDWIIGMKSQLRGQMLEVTK